ncbi:SDR family NAD(P)-dependent oxidoreductase [Rhizobium chutanense]|uniref:SDR family NAD(P)-dependent oxidoreductase n=1 Tax=Rhizobium chutanense TaxID=2035448 RepID=A0A3S0T3X5_9HYPH|nr:SDR family NAD(P)-dependent oxidoreductase [Rhizobium chutanense]RUM06042.1 SDR family NAD(P)-dependent oxidoreductase [Rhizobium chutanense]
MSSNVAVVTGASRGLGRGIARALGGKGLIVYITGRNLEELGHAAEEINSKGGKGVAVQCDHADDSQVKALLERVGKETGRLDILVNNAAAVNLRALPAPGGFWEKPLGLADMITVGLRSNYVASYFAAPLMIETGKSLMAHISFYGAVSYHYGPAYGAAKAGTDKMNFDMAIDLRRHGVSSVSIWPGLILSDMLKAIPKENLPAKLAADLPNFETPEFTGLVIERLWRDPDLMERSGEAFISAQLGMEFGIKDLDGKQPRLYSELGSPSGRFVKPSAAP